MNTNELRTHLSTLSWPSQLKNTARDDYGYVSKPTDTKDEIIDAIVALHAAKMESASIKDSDELKPGYARIKITTHERAGGKSEVPIMLNGQGYTAMRNKVIDIPIKHMQALQETQNDMLVKNDTNWGEVDPGGEVTTFSEFTEEENDFSFSVIAMNPGPDPAPTPYERQAKAQAKARRELAAKYGRDWLTDKEAANLQGRKHSSDEWN